MKTVKINGNRLKNMFIYGVYILSGNKAELDSLNIFPVPDGDTGTNMSLTAQAAVKELQKLGDDCTCQQVADAVAGGSLRGARGNSGVILSQLLRGLSKGLKNKKEITTADFAHALKLSQETAYKAVMKPKEGTVLTVARVVADRAVEYAKVTDDFSEFFKKILECAYTVLAHTKDMLPALKAANVVDAGGKGLIYIYEGMMEGLLKNAPSEGAAAPVQSVVNVIADINPEDIEFGYCTEFFIDVKAITDEKMAEITNFLSKNGDSVVAVNDDDIVKIHVHTNNPGVILEYAIKVGPLSSIKIENMRLQHTSIINEASNKKEYEPEKFLVPVADKTNKNIGIVAVSAGDGINRILTDLGVDRIITGGQTMNPSTSDILKAVESIDKPNILILPNNKNIVLAAKQAADIIEKELHKKAVVVNTVSVPEGISAMIAMVHGKSLEETALAMADGAKSVKTGLVTEAVRDSEVDGQVVKKGDYIGLIEGVIEVLAGSYAEACRNIIDKFKDDCEIISIYYGEGGTKDEGRQIVEYVEDLGLECDLQYGGQPVYPYIISAE